jgi:ABC-2 type transport system ATP-binding protein
VVIINKGKLVTTDSVENLQKRARGAESILVEVAGRNGNLDPTQIQDQLRQVAGVSQVTLRQVRPSGATLEIEGQKGFARGDLARAVVQAGWDLNELRSAAMSLEEVFLQLTGKQSAPAPQESALKGAQ